VSSYRIHLGEKWKDLLLLAPSAQAAMDKVRSMSKAQIEKQRRLVIERIPSILYAKYDVNYRDQDGRTALNIAMKENQSHLYPLLESPPDAVVVEAAEPK
jgi:ankyrin repeat protein